MFFLVTGASGVGKSTIRQLVAPAFAGVLEAAELAVLGETPQWDIAWRHRMVERMVQYALAVQRDGKHFLFCGDPVPPGEVWAAPSASQLDQLAVCLLDASEAAQTDRLTLRGDDASFIRSHVAFARWMRRHVVDPGHRPDVITQNAWPEMRWERWVGTSREPPWSSCIVDTSDKTAKEVAHIVTRWIQKHTGLIPTISV